MISLILPEITLFCGALFILMADVFLGKKIKDFFYISHLFALIFCGITLFSVIGNLAQNALLFNQMLAISPLTSFIKAIATLLLTIVILMSLGFIFNIKRIGAEFLALLMIATAGGMILLSANDFLVFYLGLELQALSLYLLAALNRTSAKSSEAGMKYFILGSVASGILLFGISMIYGFAGTTNFTALMQLYHATPNSAIPIAVMLGFILVITAMFFKTSAAPFHMWAPDVYEGSATIVTTFFATVVKLLTVLTLVKLFETLVIGWPGIEKIFIFTALLSIAVGSFGAIFQKNLKRLFAYSSIAHVGFVLLGASAFGRDGFASCVLYMLIYSFISIGTFGFLILMRSKNQDGSTLESDADNEKIYSISSLSGLAKTNPIMAFAISVLMLSTAGIPPFAGFFSKFYVLAVALSHNFLIPTIAAILLSVVAAYYYLRIIKTMYFDEPSSANQISLLDIGNIKFIVVTMAIFNVILIAFLNPLMNLIANFLTF